MGERLVRRPCTVGVIGSGNLSRALIPYLLSTGISLSGIWARNVGSARRLSRENGVPAYTILSALVQLSDIVVLAVSDDAILALARRIALNPIEGKLFVHSGGCLSINVLNPIAQAGGHTAVVHPLMSLVQQKWKSNPLISTPIGLVSSSAKWRKIIGNWLKANGHPVFSIPAGSRGLYHAGAVMACAGIHQVFLSSARLLSEETGLTIRQAMTYLAPMSEVALQVAVHDPAASISGPWSRKDSNTVRLHLDALRSVGHRGQKVIRLYKALMDLSLETG